MLSKFALAAAALALFAACSNKDAPPPQSAGDETKAAASKDQAATPPPADTTQAAALPSSQPVAPKPGADLEQSAGEASAPFILTLSGPTAMPDKGEVEIVARIAAPHELKVPASISVALPKGVTLTSGKERELLPSIPAGDTTRTFKVSLAGKLEQPIKIIVDAKDPAGAMGAHAERAYPADLKPASRPGSNVPPPPVGRPTGLAPKR